MTEKNEQKIENTTDQKPKTEQAIVRKSSLWKKGLYLSAVLFLPIFLLLILLSTSIGQRYAIKFVDKFMDNLSIEQVEGGLQQGLTLHNIAFQATGINTRIQQAHLQIDLSCLLKAQICLQNLTVQQPEIRIDTHLLPPTENKEVNTSPMQKIHLPISVQVEQVQVKNLALYIDQTTMTLAHFNTSLSLNNAQGFTLLPTNINDFFIQTQSSNDPSTEQTTSEKNNQPINWQHLEQQLTPALLGNLERIELPFDLHLTDIQGKNWQYQHHLLSNKNSDREETTTKRVPSNIQQIDIPHLQLQVEATDNLVQLKVLSIESSLGSIQGTGQLQLDNDFPLDFTLNSQLSGDNTFSLPNANITLTLSGQLLKQTILHLQSEGQINAELIGNVQLNKEKTPFDLKLTSKTFQYPFNANEKDPLKIKNIDLTLSGNLLDYQLNLNTSLSGIGIAQTQLTSQIKGQLSQAHIEQFELDTLQGKANLTGDLNWKNGLEWQSKINFTTLDIAQYLPSISAQLSGEVNSTGAINNKGWLIEIPLLNINGRLSRQPFSLTGGLTSNKEKWLQVPNFLLNYGKNRITIQGEISQQSDLSLNIQAPDLRGLLPDLSATLIGYVKLKGDIREPNLNIDLTGNNIRFQQLQLNKFIIKSNISSQEFIQGDLKANLLGLKYGDIAFNQIMLSLVGDEKNHRLQLQSQGKPVAANLNLVGNFDRTSQIWNGKLSGIDIQSPIGKWHTNQGIDINYNQTNIETKVSSHCWLNADIELCFPQTFTAGKTGEIPFQLRKFDLNLVNKLLKEEQFQGQMKGQLKSNGLIAWFTDKPFKFDLQLDGNHLSVAQKIDYRTLTIEIPKIALNTKIENNNLSLDSTINLLPKGQITTKLTLQDLVNNRNLGGSFTIQGLNLNIVNQLLTSSEHINGDIAANLTLGGNLKTPLLQGTFAINNLSAAMKTLPFDIKNGDLAIRFTGNRSTLQGYVENQDSRLNVAGEASWKSLENWNTRIKATADRFSVNIPSIAKLKISPDIEIAATPKRLEVLGTVDVPWARIAIEELPDSAVAVSSDEVILDGPDKTKNILKKGEIKARTQSGMEIRSDLKINIGNDVTLNAYGLNTSLNGLLSVKQDKGKLGLFGQIYLKNGRYSSFGQDLLIRKGQISFSGLPSQPMLNIEAIRNPTAMENSNILAGVKVIGVATAPEVTVFSEPATSQDQALSYLLTGRSLESSGEAGSGGSIGAALLGMGLAKSGKVVGGIGEAFGIQDLNLDTQGVGDGSKVVISGNITPRLQLKYGVGLFDGLAEFTVRYKLLPQLYLQSVSGVNHAVDLLYHFDF